MSKLEDIKYSGNPFRRRNRIEEALKQTEFLPTLDKETREPEGLKFIREESVEPKPSRAKVMVKRALLILLAAVALWALVSGSLYIYRQFVSARDNEPTSVVSAVGKLVSLPADETPTVATVSDLAPLKGQAFFQDAVLGDKVIIYSTAKKAILYRPSTGRIIIVAPIK